MLGMTYMFVGLKHWIFSMKHWKLSLVTSQLLDKNRKQEQIIEAKVSKFETAIYYTFIALNIIEPMLYILITTFQDTGHIKQALSKYFVIGWAVLGLVSFAFLADAYRRISNSVLKLSESIVPIHNGLVLS